ncbi:MAG: phosphoribosylanthranilate isomerase [Pirellulaceae bacterium]|nr:phosphoribosylanthranilate isomerase [Pirellulaceae bacterium]
MHVKICGNRSADDVDLACRCGADSIGILVGTHFFSEDAVPIEAACKLVSRVPSGISTVLVTHLTDVEAVARLVETGRFQAIQLHHPDAGDMLADLRRRCPGARLIAAVLVEDDQAVRQSAGLQTLADAIVLDTRCGGRIGGTGKTHDWSISRRIVERSAVPVLLAGGLNPDNVRRALDVVRPWGVDVNSGVDAPDGAKDPERVARFIERARSWSPGSAGD